LTADERKILLASGAAGGIAATFNAPLASILLAVELLLFEWRPRSMVPVASAVAMATVVRLFILGTAPVFPVDAQMIEIHWSIDALAVFVGLAGATLAIAATHLVYWAENAFPRLPIHWMWWPAIGGLIIGAGGLIEPRALGVGYNVIGALLEGHAGMSLIVGILVVKTSIWALSLGSGTSGGVFAPVFMIGSALGAFVGHWLPHVYPGFWAMLRHHASALGRHHVHPRTHPRVARDASGDHRDRHRLRHIRVVAGPLGTHREDRPKRDASNA
jgi:chloride channel protein, CIC family